ncbi:unnamed protein product [Adineta steineri]|uniref:Uncharacterized protein n=1 Tax=Adineta steineri TaxID=433720 RepID=A0A819Q725_9BILA|nr:unnamed protein product [Adineta steineri]
MMKRSATSNSSKGHQGTTRSTISTGSQKPKEGSLTNSTSRKSRPADTTSDISCDEADDPVPRKKARVSLIHTYADKISDTQYKCKFTLCDKIIRCSSGSNANIRRHLINVHGVTEVKLNDDPEKHDKQFDVHRKAILDEAAINCIIVDSRPFGDFRKTGMQKFLTKALPGYIGPHENVVRAKIKKLYSTKMLQLQEELYEVHYVCLTADLWKRPKGHHYLCMTIHYVDRNYRNVSKVLSFRRFHGRHLSSRIRRHLTRVINRFGLESKIVAIVTDNGSDIRAATQHSNTFGIRLHCLCHGLNLVVKNGLYLWKVDKKKDVSTDSESSSNNNEHQEASNNELIVDKQLNSELDEDDDDEEEEETLAISSDEDDLNSEMDDESGDEAPRNDMDIISSDEEIDDNDMSIYNTSFHVNKISVVLERCRKIINTINKSSILYEFTQNLANPDIKGNLSIDMRIRWNSTFKMLNKLIKYQPIITQLINELPTLKGISSKQKKVLLKSQLSNEEWDIIKTLSVTLSYFSDASDMLSGSGYPSYATAYIVINSLKNYLQLNTPNRIEQIVKDELKKSFVHYVINSSGSPEHNLLLVEF